MISRQRRRSEPIKNDDDSDENEIGVLDYNEDKYFGWNYDADVPAPVQLKRPDRFAVMRRPSDKLHLAVWDNDPAKVQKLVLTQGNFSDLSLFVLEYKTF